MKLAVIFAFIAIMVLPLLSAKTPENGKVMANENQERDDEITCPLVGHYCRDDSSCCDKYAKCVNNVCRCPSIHPEYKGWCLD